MLDHLTAASLSFLPLSLQASLLAELRAARRASTDARHDIDWLRAALATAARDTDAARDLFTRATTRAAQALERAARLDITIVPWGADDYPARLAEIADPPPLLWCRGVSDGDATPAVDEAVHGALHHALPWPVLPAPSLAIVGSRAASAYGIEVASRLAADLADAGLVVVSGLARGADSAAHRGALTRGRTIAVLGSGADVIYPREHERLAAEILERGGAIVSELPPGAPPRREHFPRRNRLISGMTLGVLVVEASERSGSLQTARFAAEQGREVMAVPGSILGERNRGAHALLRDGAILVERVEDVLNEIRWPAADAQSEAPPGEAVSRGHGTSEAQQYEPVAAVAPFGDDRLTRMGRRLLSGTVEGEAYDFQSLTDITGAPADTLLRELLFLELDGRIARTGDGRFFRAGRPVIR